MPTGCNTPHPTEHHYAQAVVGYTKAIALWPGSAVYFANRSIANLRLENYGSAIADATRALELDPTYAKAQYRRGDAHFAMGKYKEAVKDFKTAARLAPKDPDVRKKLSEAEKVVKRMRFEEALAVPVRCCWVMVLLLLLGNGNGVLASC